MRMFRKIIMGAGTGLLLLFGTQMAQAATLSIVGGNDVQLNGGFSLGTETGLSIGTTVKKFNWSNANASNGLQISGAPTDVTFTYLGSDATEQNRFILSQGRDATLFDTNASLVGDTEALTISNNGTVPFYFQRENGQVCVFFVICWNATDSDAANNGAIDWLLSIAFFQESATSVIALFGDGAGDHDYDDMAVRISVTAVPLPPAMLLFGGALLGLRWISRRRQQMA